MNIVYQRDGSADADQKFDLIIGTNLFIYYGAFEQSMSSSEPCCDAQAGRIRALERSAR